MYLFILSDFICKKSGKAVGLNGLSNEFYIYGNSLVDVLHTIFNMMMKTSILPTGFNTSLIIPIPKSKEILAPADYRSISVSTPMCTILELLLKQRMLFPEDQHSNHFGYKNPTSCKSAYYVVNELLFITCLGDPTALSSVWMLPKLLTNCGETVFSTRSSLGLKLVCGGYCINTMVRAMLLSTLEGYRSDVFKINEGVKQGGTLYSFLFNFFLDDLLNGLLSLEIGSLVGNVNTSVLTYCDDILLLASNEIKIH